jgi:hypothetical protein
MEASGNASYFRIPLNVMIFCPSARMLSVSVPDAWSYVLAM